MHPVLQRGILYLEGFQRTDFVSRAAQSMIGLKIKAEILLHSSLCTTKRMSRAVAHRDGHKPAPFRF